jgi:hypothetical protein
LPRTVGARDLTSDGSGRAADNATTSWLHHRGLAVAEIDILMVFASDKTSTS